jgi:pimeloyl-ACP methyl ester carboxylesterase
MSEPVLLLHGQPGGAADWDGVIAALGDRAQPLAIDRPGWDGRTRARDLAGNAAAALAVLDDHGVGRATVVGHSLGAAIAAWIAAHHPDRVRALVLAAPAANLASAGALDRWLAAPAVAEVAAAVGMGGLGLALSSRRVRMRLNRSGHLDPGYLRRSRATLLAPGAWRAYATEQRALIRDLPRLERVLGAIATPTTIVAADNDRIVPPAAARRLAEQIPGARLQVAPGGGHMLPQREPARVARAILAALAADVGSTLSEG